jgi:hypothetical protein
MGENSLYQDIGLFYACRAHNFTYFNLNVVERLKYNPLQQINSNFIACCI